MRIEEVFQICKQYQHDLKIPMDIIKRYADRQYEIVSSFEDESKVLNKEKMLKKALRQARFAIVGLDKLTFLQNDINKVLATDEDNPQEVRVDTYKVIYDKICGVIEMCEMMGYTIDDKEIGFTIKVPTDSNLIELSNCVSDIQLVLSQCPFLIQKDATISLKKVDVGSTWLDFVIVGVEAAALLGVFSKLVDKVLMLWSHIKTIKQQEEMLRSAQLDNELLEMLIRDYEKVSEALITKIIDQLSEKELNEEDKSRAKLCLDKLVIWFEKGLEIHDLIKTNKETKLVFPTSEKWAEIQESVLKLLDDKKEDNDL